MIILDMNEEAIETFNKAIEIDPRNTEFYLMQAVALHNFSKYEEAIQVLNKGIEIDPKNSEIYDSKAFTLIHLSKHDEAIEASEQAIKLDPKNANFYRNKGSALCGRKGAGGLVRPSRRQASVRAAVAHGPGREACCKPCTFFAWSAGSGIRGIALPVVLLFCLQLCPTPRRGNV